MEGKAAAMAAWMDACLLEKQGVETDYKEEWEAQRFMLCGKMFAMRGGDKTGKPIFTMKLEPAFGAFLRQQYPEGIVPGYYMNKEHWNSLYLEADVPEPLVREMLDKCYDTGLSALTIKARKALLEQGK